LIHGFITEHTSSGHCLTLLKNFLNRLEKANKACQKDGKPLHNIVPMIGISVDIAILHPRTHPLITGILSLLLSHVDNPSEMFFKIKKRLDVVPNNGHLEIWLQRISSPAKIHASYEEALCHLIENNDDSKYGLDLWNSDWIKSEKLKTALKTSKVINKKITAEMTPVIPSAEVDVFDYQDNTQMVESLLANFKSKS
jgi:hypothetical protein